MSSVGERWLRALDLNRIVTSIIQISHLHGWTGEMYYFLYHSQTKVCKMDPDLETVFVSLHLFLNPLVQSQLQLHKKKSKLRQPFHFKIQLHCGEILDNINSLSRALARSLSLPLSLSLALSLCLSIKLPISRCYIQHDTIKVSC